MLDSRKVEALLQWLGCFNIKVTKLSELGDGLQLLKLLSTIEPECTTENVTPAEAFVQVEQILIGSFNGSLPAGFLSSAAKGCCRDGTLAVATALALSSLVLHATRCNASDDLAPLLALDEAAQFFIKDVVQIASAGDSVIKNLSSYLGAASTEADPSDVISPPTSHARKSESFTFSPSVESPRKTPERRPLLLSQPAQRKEMQLYREHIQDEEEMSAMLQAEVSLLKAALKGKDQEIQRQREHLATLEAASSDDASCLERQREHIEHLERQNSRLQEQVLSMQRVREDYDDLIRENAALEHENQQLTNREEEKKGLEVRLAAALSHVLELRAELSASEEARESLASAMAEQERDLESMREFYASRQEARLPSLDSSPQTPCTPTERRGMTCFQELRLADLEEDTARLKEENRALRVRVGELEAKLTDQTELQKCIEECRARIEVLQRHRDQLASEAVEGRVCELKSGRRQERVREVLREADHSSDAATSRIGELERRLLEVELAERERRLAEAGARCKILENKNAGLKMVLEGLRTKVRKSMQEAASNAAVLEASHKKEVEEWKQRLDKERALCSRQEALLMQHPNDMIQKLESLNRDAAQLKSQLAEKSAELVTAAKERTRLAAENRSLKAQLSYCDAKLRDSLEAEKSSRSRAGASNASLYSPPSLDSLWSQRPPDTRQNSLAIIASERFPERHSFRGEASEEEVFDWSVGSRGPPSEEDTLRRLSELRRRNSLVPRHLRSCYPVEMQDRPLLPPDALTADSGLLASPSRDISSPASPNVGVGRQTRRGTEGAPFSTGGGERSSSSGSDRRWV